MDEIARREMFMQRYRLGDIPWDSGRTPPELIVTLLSLPPGRALDLGCGTGLNVCTLATGGWEATGVDFVPEAIARAKQRGCSAATFVVGDVSQLDKLPLEGPFDLFLDMGCFHGLSDGQRDGYAHHVKRLAAPDARLLLYAALPRADAQSGPRGVGPDEIATRFAPTFTMQRHEVSHDASGQWASAWYWLHTAAALSD